MRRVMSGALVLLMVVPALGAADRRKGEQSPQPSAAFQALQKEYAAAKAKHEEALAGPIKAVRAAKTAEERQEALKKAQEVVRDNPNPRQAFAEKFLALAEQAPQDPSAYQALYQALRLGGPPGTSKVWGKAVAEMQKHHVKREEMAKVARMLASATDEASEKLLRAVVKENPDRRARALALQSLAQSRETLARIAEILKANEALRDRYAERAGKEELRRVLALDVEKTKGEVGELRRVVEKEYDDVIPVLAPGHKAPEIQSQDLDGKPVRLSDLKGKVVVLDIWATWCGPCRAMIPHEREMVKRLEGKPFVLVGISADDSPQTVKDFLKKEPMPWTHWFNGPTGGIIEDWSVQYYPTIYVLDHKGVIRYKDVREEELEKAVNKLLGDVKESSDS